MLAVRAAISFTCACSAALCALAAPPLALAFAGAFLVAMDVRPSIFFVFFFVLSPSFASRIDDMSSARKTKDFVRVIRPPFPVRVFVVLGESFGLAAWSVGSLTRAFCTASTFSANSSTKSGQNRTHSLNSSRVMARSSDDR